MSRASQVFWSSPRRGETDTASLTYQGTAWDAPTPGP